MIYFDSSGIPKLQSPQWNSFLSRTFHTSKEFFDIAGHAQSDVADHGMRERIDLEKLFQ